MMVSHVLSPIDALAAPGPFHANTLASRINLAAAAPQHIVESVKVAAKPVPEIQQPRQLVIAAVHARHSFLDDKLLRGASHRSGHDIPSSPLHATFT
jgi:hypothetical protein